MRVFRDIQAKRNAIASAIDQALENAQHLSDLKNEIEDSKKRKEDAANEKGKMGEKLNRTVKRTVWENLPSTYYSTWCRQHPVDENNIRSACHENCGLPYNPDGGTVFQGCAAVNGKPNCNICGCGWQSHYHSNTRFVAKEVEQTEVDKMVEDRINRLQSLMDEAEARQVQSMSSAEKVEHLIELSMRDVVRTAGDLVVLCNGFDLAQDLSNQISGLEKRIAVTVDHQLKELLEETKEALITLQQMAAQTATAAAAQSLHGKSQASSDKEPKKKPPRRNLKSFYGELKKKKKKKLPTLRRGGVIYRK